MSYYYRDDNSGFGCFFALLLFIFIVAVLALIAYFAFIVFAIIFFITIGVSAVIGTVITLKNYISALVNSIRTYSILTAPPSWKFPKFTYKWRFIIYQTIKDGWLNTINGSKNSFQVGFNYKFFSIRRWYHWFFCVSTFVFGLLISIFIFAFHLSLVFALLLLFLFALGLLICVSIIASIAMAVYRICRNCINVGIYASKTLAANNFPRYVTDYGYKNFFNCFALIWKGTGVSFRKAIDNFKRSKVISFVKWSYFFQIPMLYIVMAVLTPIIIVVGLLVQSVLFVSFKIAEKFR